MPQAAILINQNLSNFHSKCVFISFSLMICLVLVLFWRFLPYLKVILTCLVVILTYLGWILLSYLEALSWFCLGTLEVVLGLCLLVQHLSCMGFILAIFVVSLLVLRLSLCALNLSWNENISY